MLPKSTEETLNKELNQTCKELKVPGMALTIYQDGQSIYENYYGYRNIDEALPVTKDTIFGLASITKSLTCLMVMKLEEEGKLSHNDKVINWLPQLQLPREDYLKQLEIKHLMSHTSGLPGLPCIHNARIRSIQNDPDGEFLFGEWQGNENAIIQTVDELIEQISNMDFELLGPPGAVFNYSNEGFGLLQKIIELASGMTFIEYVDEKLFSPLQLKDSYFLTKSLMNRENVTELYAYKEKQSGIFHSPAWWDVGDIYTNGSWKASADNLMKYVEMLRLNGTFQARDIITEDNIEKMISPAFSLPNGGDYGYGIEINSIGEYTRFGHGGGIKGVSSNFQVIREKGISASILINMADVPAEKILVTALNIILGIPNEEPFKESNILPGEALNWRIFSGVYQSGEGDKASVSIQDDVLYLNRNELITCFYPISENDFIAETGERIYFSMDGDRVHSVLIGKRVLEKVER
ncbi:serine hydrolase domain-containing protein [Oceanobacillus jeddahense]|uniref:Beta-lactamase family protein n=1 Tax=Oceanobacillus jeddahense TaxID=1462527 RepID=A0ABY5JQK5_9BACI|nr:serine hydrolase domain-containing protein [Oceanobacillus jeddahense]UUI02401.1 beta-lactamase family protein [Oceanobacillus jeddahense]